MQNPPQTLSIKRKRHEAPVDALVVERERGIKKQKSQNLDSRPIAQPSSGHFYRRLTKPNDTPQQSLAPPTPTAERRFYIDATSRTQNKRVFVEERAAAQRQAAVAGELHTPVKQQVPEEQSRPQKRPGRSTAYHPTPKSQTQSQTRTPEPSAHDVSQLEALSKQVEKEDNLHIPLPSPSKHKPKAPAQRFAQRHPEKAAALAAQETATTSTDGDAMDIDGDDYVYDTYIREPILPDAPAPTGTVGTLVIAEEDEDWWNGEDESDKEFDTDDEDENAEDYYANDYPEDELDEDDEFGRDVYQRKNRHGSDDEEFNAGSSEEEGGVGSGGEGDEDDAHFRMTVPGVKRVGYWGAVGEV